MEQIKASDLRIGNKLYRDGIIVTIDGRSIFDIAFNEKIASEYSPIPLTPAILGYQFYSDGRFIYFSMHDSPNIQFLEDDEKEYALWLCNDSKPIGIPINTVHHLQNVIHSLTGKELAITL